MSLRLNDLCPNFTANSTMGPIDFHKWIGDSWVMLFSHPKDYTPVCTTELGAVAHLEPEFKKRNCKIIGLSIDSVEDHKGWLKDVEETQTCKINYPVIADTDLKVAKLYDMFPTDESGNSKERTPALNATARSVFFIGPDKKIKLMLTYPMTTGRNFEEFLRVLDSMQLTQKHKVATPANWKMGQKVIISPALNDEEAKKVFTNGWETKKPYLRLTDQPK